MSSKSKDGSFDRRGLCFGEELRDRKGELEFRKVGKRESFSGLSRVVGKSSSSSDDSIARGTFGLSRLNMKSLSSVLMCIDFFSLRIAELGFRSDRDLYGGVSRNGDFANLGGLTTGRPHNSFGGVSGTTISVDWSRNAKKVKT